MQRTQTFKFEYLRMLKTHFMHLCLSATTNTKPTDTTANFFQPKNVTYHLLFIQIRPTLEISGKLLTIFFTVATQTPSQTPFHMHPLLTPLHPSSQTNSHPSVSPYTLSYQHLRNMTPLPQQTKMIPSCPLVLLSTCLSLPLKQKSLPSFMPLKTNNAILTQFLPPYLKNVQTFSSQL